MISRILLAVLATVLFVNFASASQACTELMCMSAGQNCSSAWSVCGEGLYCNLTDPTNLVLSCVSADPIGSPCTQSAQCVGSDYSKSLCWNGTCSTITYTQTEGQACSNLAQCSNNAYCNNTNTIYPTGVCLPFLQNGANCSSGAPCAPGSACNADSCISMFSVPEGGQCDYYPQAIASVVCAPGLYCNATGTSQGYCVVAWESSNEACNLTLWYCNNTKESCTCNGFDAFCTAPPTYTSSEVSDVRDYFKCIASATCGMADPTCCKSKNCFEYKAQPSFMKEYMHECQGQVYDHCRGLFGLSKPAFIGIIAGACAAVVLLIAVTVVCVRRRHHHHYEHIQH